MIRSITVGRARRSLERGRRALAENDLVEAGRAFEKTLERTGKRPGTNPEADALAAAARIGMGRLRLAAADFVAADRWFDTVLRGLPGSWEGLYWSGCAAAGGTSYARADWFFTAALRAGAADGRANLQRALVRTRLGQEAAALEDLRAVVQYRPLDEPAAQIASVLALRQGQLTQAAWFASTSRSPIGAAVAGAAAFGRGDDRAALDAHTWALDGGLHEPLVLAQHGAAAYRLAEYDLAVDSWSRLPGRERYVAAAQYARGYQRLLAGDLHGAVSDLEEAAEHGFAAPLDDLRLRAAAEAAVSGDLQGARARLKTGDDPRASAYIGLIEHADGDTEAAERAWRRDPAAPIARLGLALTDDDADHELRALSDAAMPPAIRWTAARALGSRLAARGEWEAAREALAASCDRRLRGHELYGECLYRAGMDTELLDMPANPWHGAAQLRADHDGMHARVSGRAAHAAALLLGERVIEAATESEWERVATLLAQRDRVGEAAPLSEILSRAFSGQTVLWALGGHRTEAAERLDEAGAGAGGRLAHLRALVLLHGPDFEQRAEAAIAAWAQLLVDGDYWNGWAARAAARHGTSVPPRVIADMHGRLRRLVEDRAVQSGVDDAPALTARENSAAELLASLDGLPLDDGGRIACGPLRIAELGLHAALGRFTCSQTSSPHYTELTLQFSTVGLARARLDAGQTTEALKAALDTRCPACQDDRGAYAKPRLCERDCPEFDRLNPAFAAMWNKREALASLASSVAAEALIDLGTAAITKRSMEIDKAVKRWDRALQCVDAYGHRKTVLSSIVDTVIGRAETLQRRRDMHGALDLLDAVFPLLRGDDGQLRERMATQLSRLLGWRGVDAANNGRGTVGREDLERAVRLAPHQVKPRRNLGVVIQNMAMDRLRSASDGALTEPDLRQIHRLLGEAVAEFEAGLRNQPGHTELVRLREEAATAYQTFNEVLLRIDSVAALNRIQRRSW